MFYFVYFYSIANYAEKNGEVTVAKGLELFTLGNLYDTFNITFELQVASFPSGSNEVFRMTNKFTGQGTAGQGQRQPVVRYSAANNFYIQTDVDNSYPAKITYSGTLVVNTWHKIQIQQSIVKGLWTVQLFVDDAVSANTLQFKARTPHIYENTKAFAWDPRYGRTNADAKIKDVKVWTGKYHLFFLLTQTIYPDV